MSGETISCPVCDGTQVTLFRDGSGHALSETAFGSSRTELSFGRILRCRSCTFGFSELRPTEDQLLRLYRDLNIDVYESETPGRIRTAQRHLQILTRHAPSPGRILDVGCASGRFLEACAAADWEIVGIEPSRVLSEEAAGLLRGKGQVLPMTLQEANLAPASFDAVTMWDVLEHVTLPFDFLRHTAGLLRPGGVLLLNVPDLNSVQARVFGRRWPLFLPEHLNYFTRRSLALCGRNAGLTLVETGRRSVNFSLGYIAFRVSQHVPSLSRMNQVVSRSALAKWIIPVRMGELYSVWTKPDDSKQSRNAA